MVMTLALAQLYQAVSATNMQQRKCAFPPGNRTCCTLQCCRSILALSEVASSLDTSCPALQLTDCPQCSGSCTSHVLLQENQNMHQNEMLLDKWGHAMPVTTAAAVTVQRTFICKIQGRRLSTVCRVQDFSNESAVSATCLDYKSNPAS